MAGTTKKLLLKIAVAGAQSAETAKEKLAFLQIAMILYDKNTSKKKAKEVMTAGMKALLGISESEKGGK